MTFEQYLMYIKHMNIEQFNQCSLDAKMLLEYEYAIEYGF